MTKPVLPEDRVTEKLRVGCPKCLGDKIATYASAITGTTYEKDCDLCDGEGEVHPATRLDWLRSDPPR